MGSYEIGLSGLNAAQKALDVIGNNIANAATEGYHRQRVELNPTEDVYVDGVYIGQGVEFEGITRLIDKFLDGQIVNQESTMGQISKELEALRTMESTFGELSTDGLSTAMDNFFGALHELSAKPKDKNYQYPVISAAQSLVNQLRSLGTTVSDLDARVYEEAQSTIESINSLAAQIAQLNDDIYTMTVSGNDANSMRDQRDQLITELARLTGITTVEMEYGVVNISVKDAALVAGGNAFELEVGLVANGGNYDFGIAPAGTNNYSTELIGGKLGGLFSLNNEILCDVGNKLDTLAKTIVFEVNKLHVQGVGASGSFERLTGWTMTGQNLSDFDPPLVDGQTLYVRVTYPDGLVVREPITVDAGVGGDTLTSMAAKFAAVTGLSGSQVSSGQLEIVADAGYTFDFLPGVLAEPPAPGADNTMTGNVPDIDISGIYTGSTNKTYTFTVVGNGTVGSGTVSLIVNDGSGVVATINVGNGYVPGTVVNMHDGIKISLDTNGSNAGDLNDGELFRISALANSDASGFLAATGVNCFFSGTTSISIAVTDYVSNSVNGADRIAVSGSVGLDDNVNVLAMAKLGDSSIIDLGGLTLKQYYRDIATDIGEQISLAQVRQDTASGIWRSLTKQRDETSGVDMNDEAAKMLLFERMFQAMAKYINTISRSLDTLIELI
jgi:flagellar hook-associated protein 1 FlgK